MSVRVTGLVWDADLPQAKKFVLLALADHADHEGRNVYPSVERTAWKTGYSERQIQRIIRELEDDGILQAVKNLNGGRGQPVNYSIILTNLPNRAGWEAPKRVTSATEKGDISATERVTSATRKGDTAMSPEPSIESSLEPSEKTPLTPLELDAECEATFISFWTNYPGRRRVDKEKCRKWWSVHVCRAKDRHMFAASIHRGLARWKESPDWVKDGGEFVPMPYTWLNNKRWETPPEPVANKTGEWVG